MKTSKTLLTEESILKTFEMLKVKANNATNSDDKLKIFKLIIKTMEKMGCKSNEIFEYLTLETKHSFLMEVCSKVSGMLEDRWTFLDDHLVTGILENQAKKLTEGKSDGNE